MPDDGRPLPQVGVADVVFFGLAGRREFEPIPHPDAATCAVPIERAESLSASIICAALRVVASAITAALPMRLQYPPGIALLVLAPVMIGFLGYQHGTVWLLLGLAAFVSMFRRPLVYLARKAMGLVVRRAEDE